MADPMDRCTICFETFAPLVSQWPVSKLHPNVLSWPCGHRVHVACILQSLASLRSTETPCFVCRTPPFPHVRSYLEKWHGEVVALLEADAPPGVPWPAAEDPPVPVTAMTYIPTIVAALCCPRVLSYSADLFGEVGRRTRFVELEEDRRMTFMGLDRHTGALQWTCLSCNQELSTIGVPGAQERARRICSRHGAMCFTFDCRGDRIFASRGAEPQAPYWSCMDHQASLHDVALPINHLRIPAAVGLPCLVAASDDEESEGWSSTSAMSSTMSANNTHQPMMEDTWIHQLVYSKARLQPHPCCIGHNAKRLKRGACFETHAARTDCCTPEKSSRESL